MLELLELWRAVVPVETVISIVITVITLTIAVVRLRARRNTN